MSAFVFHFDEPLSHLIYAGSDLLVVPSTFEPCGLTQLIAMRYGSIPVVRRTGGLRDTVFDVDEDQARAAEAGLEPNGFAFDGADEISMDYALDRAMAAKMSPQWNSLVSRVMSQDWGWRDPAKDYIEAYWCAKKAAAQ